jgi:hypothetical protein
MVKLHDEQEQNLQTAQVRVIFVQEDTAGWVHGCQFLEQLDDRVVERLASAGS